MALSTEAKTILDEVIEQTSNGERLRLCLQCGTCGGSCPSGPDMDHTPRRLFALMAAGERGQVLRSNTPWYCVSCYYCMVRCPQEIPITDIMYTLKRMSVREKTTADSTAPDLSRTFLGFVERYGRSFEFGLATRFHLTHSPLKAAAGQSPLALGMLSKRRLSLRPTRIRGLEQFRAIVSAARKLEAH